jgi:TRAP-type C4-dicarboxylate transport system permease small subunit
MKKRLQQLAIASSSALASFPLLAGSVSAEEIAVDGLGFFTDIGQLINRALRFIMVIAALLVFLYLIWGGIEWITSGGDKGKTESARNKITAAVIGLIVVAASYAILQLALTFLGVGNINDVVGTLST